MATRFASKLLVLGSIFALTAPSFGQVGIGTLPAGVEVDAQGTLRMRRYADPTGQLTKQRLAQIKAALDPQLARPSKLRKVSLNRLEAAIQDAIQNGAGVSDEMRYLAGLTKLQYVFAYPNSGDIVIAGPAEGFGQDLSGRVIGLASGRSILELQDLIVALRSFPPRGEATPVISCSIDPTQEGLARMQQFLMSIAGRVQPGDATRIAAGLQGSLGKQTVTIEGISASTHFAQVLVEADYRMKLIGIGLETPPVRIISYVQRANPSSVARNALQRWYFVPEYDALKVSDDGLALELVGDGVKLIGEDEMVSTVGGRTRSGRVDRASQAFVTSFTNRYEELARYMPVYGQLRNLIDMAIAAAYIQENDLYGELNWEMTIFGSEDAYPVETYQVPTYVDSSVNVVWKGSTLMTPIGGGVSIQPRQALSSGHLLSDEEGDVAEAKTSISTSQLAPGQWWWD